MSRGSRYIKSIDYVVSSHTIDWTLPLGGCLTLSGISQWSHRNVREWHASPTNPETFSNSSVSLIYDLWSCSMSTYSASTRDLSLPAASPHHHHIHSSRIYIAETRTSTFWTGMCDVYDRLMQMHEKNTIQLSIEVLLNRWNRGLMGVEELRLRTIPLDCGIPDNIIASQQ